MLAICQHKDALKDLALRYLPLEPAGQSGRRNRLPDHGEYLQRQMPIFQGPDQDKPWVEEWYRYIHGR